MRRANTYQSLMTVASLAHSFRRISWMICLFSETWVPFTRLYLDVFRFSYM